MLYIVLFVGIIMFLTVTALLDPTQRRQLAIIRRSGSKHGSDPMADTIAAIAAMMVSRFGGKHGQVLRVPASVLRGERKVDRPCVTPVDCVGGKQCAGHCGCR
jgi:hypothetical protein